MASSPALTALPEELLRSCLQYLTPTHLHATCSVSKLFRRLATPLLYSTIRFSWGQTSTEEPQVEPPLALLVRSIVHDPSLAHHIRTVELEGRGFRRESYRGKTPRIAVSGLGLLNNNADAVPASEIPPPRLAAYVTLIEATGVSDVALWVRELCDGSLDAFVALLLSQTQRLERLDIGPTFANETRLLGMMFRAAVCQMDVPTQRLPYQHLTEVSYDLGWIDIWFRTHCSMQDALAFFYLPNIRHMYLFIENELSFAWPGIMTTEAITTVSCPPRPSSLQSLRLDQIREAHLDQVLSVTPSLQVLYWKWSYQPDIDPHNTPVVDLTKIARILSRVRNTLRELHITADSLPGIGDIESPPVEIVGTLGAFANLPHLQELQVPLAFLVGFEPKPAAPLRLADTVPSNIEVLTITDDLVHLLTKYLWDEDLVVDLVEEFLQNLQETHPRLRRLVLWLSDEEWLPGLKDRLNEAFVQVPLQITVKFQKSCNMRFSKPMKDL